MQSAVVCFVLCLVTFTAAYPAGNDYNYEDLARVPRVRRQSGTPIAGGSNGPLSWVVSGDYNEKRFPLGGLQQTGFVRGDARLKFGDPNDATGLFGKTYYQRNFGDSPVRQQYGAGLEYVPTDRASLGLMANRQTGRDMFGPWKNNNLRADANYDLFRSDSGNTRLTGNAYMQRSFGDFPSRTDYGAGLFLNHRF